jgi:hypothetical protein
MDILHDPASDDFSAGARSVSTLAGAPKIKLGHFPFASPLPWRREFLIDCGRWKYWSINRRERIMKFPWDTFRDNKPETPERGGHAEFYARINGRKYFLVSDESRTALVVGMVDMLEFITEKLRDPERQAVTNLTRQLRQTGNITVREWLDEYIRSDDSRLTYAIASNLLAMLFHKAKEAK